MPTKTNPHQTINRWRSGNDDDESDVKDTDV